MPNQIQALAMLPKLSEQQLLQVLQTNDGSVPSYAVMAELQARKKRTAGGAMPTSTVKDDMVSGGLQSLGPPPQMQAGERQFAEGGQVGYDDYAEARRRYLESGGQDAPPGPSGWDAIKNWFSSHPLLNGSYDAATRPPAYAAAPERAPFSDARMSGGYGPGSQPAASPRAAEQAKQSGSKESGLRSIRASTSGKVSPGGPGPAGFDFQPINLRSIGDAMKDVPMDGSLAEQIAAYKAQEGDTAERKQNAKYEALMRAGLAMARTPGNLMNSIAAGGTEGLNAYGAGMKEATAMERERMKELAALQQAQSAQALQRYGIANSTRFGEAGIQDKNQDNRSKAWQVGVESADRRYAADAGVRAAAIRADAMGGGSGSKIMSILQKADTDARADAAKNLRDLDKIKMSSSDPAVRERALAEYEAGIRKTVLDKVGMMSMADPDLIPLYQQMRGQIGAPSGGPSIIRGNGALPPGAVVRQ